MSLAMERKASLPPPFPSVCKPHCVLDLLSQEPCFRALEETETCISYCFGILFIELKKDYAGW